MARITQETPSNSPSTEKPSSSSVCRRCSSWNFQFLAKCPYGILNLLLLIVYSAGTFVYILHPPFFGEFLVSAHILVSFLVRVLLVLCYLTNTQSMGIGYFTVITEFVTGYFSLITGIVSVPFMAKEIILNREENQIFSILVTVAIVLGIFGALYHICAIKKASQSRSKVFLFNTGTCFITKKEYKASRQPKVTSL
ncbi:unnamed protein product [Bursaphelenchus xylophilus]|uniref:(pine wood nematode) hypothetical protein n=1 Tax=Bursaphelenchus xylophilus TaxID=6326 RepID=A0A1I7RYL4_BURXY|nr:unnamed protein product [Bursaphelenchus xylophilus]CAG9092558.1 unnamed protein product [Bursaphelenchus xylophilus]